MRTTLLLLLAGAALSSAVTAASPRLSFDRVFAVRGEPGGLHYSVAYRAGGGIHRMDVWRDGERRIARRTDGFLASYAVRAPDGVGYRLSLLDDRRRIRTDIDRTNLYRIGSFTDWFDLGHGLRHPKADYQLTALPAADRAEKAIAPCRWYALTQGGRTTRICWSEAVHLPLVMTTGAGLPIWRVTALAAGVVPAERFTPHDRGYIRTDADRDMDRD